MQKIIKNTKLQVVLTVIAIAIWGTIIYKILSSPPKKKRNQFTSVLHKAQVNVDTYQIRLYVRDPFLQILDDTAAIIDTPQELLSPLAKSVYPQPILSGIIQDKDNATAIIKINDKYLLMKKGAKSDEIEIVNITDSKVTILYHSSRVVLTQNNK